VATGRTLREALSMPVFWLILVAIAAGAGCLTAIFSHIVPILAERGVSLTMATAVISAFALVCAIWQVGSGLLLDRIPTPKITAPMYLAAVGGLAVLELGSGNAVLLIGGALLGVGLGTQYGAMPMLIARYFGTRSFGAIIGVMYSAAIIMQGVTPVLLDHAFDVQGTYRYALAVIGLCLTGGAALMLLLPAYRDAGAKVEMAPVHI
jgi:MFS family permease